MIKVEYHYTDNFDSVLGKISSPIYDAINRALDSAVIAAQEAYGTSKVQVSKREIGANKWAIEASGMMVAFLEFGTGYYTDGAHPFAGEVSFEVYPGSWSIDHARTWQRYINEGRDPEKYPYNLSPRYGMQRAYEAIVKAVELINARGIYG